MDNKPLRINKKRFFMNGEFHELIATNRAASFVKAYNYENNNVVTYSLSDYKKFRQQAYTIKHVSGFIERDQSSIWKAIDRGDVKKPFLLPVKKDAGKGQFGVGRVGIYYFSEDNIYELRDYFAGVHKGRPRADGIVIPYNIPSVEELDAMLGKREMVYVKDKNGQFVPIWKRVDF